MTSKCIFNLSYGRLT